MVTATYKVRTHNGRTVKMTGAIEDLDEITKAMQRATVTSALLAIAEKLDALQRQFEFYSMGNKMPGNDLYSGLLMEIVNEARAAIAAAKGEK